jgi:transcriptional regulator of heat shock response
MGAGGLVRGRLTPTLTAQEQAEADAKERRAAEVRAKLAEDKRKDRALLTRYPSKAVHEQERRDATAQLGRTIQIAQNRLVDIQKQRTVMDGELEFYKKDLSKAPARLRSQVEENNQSQTMQRQFIAAQEAEVVRVNARFDEELQRLNQLWATLMPSASASTASESAR